MRGAIAKCVADRYAVRVKTIRRNLRLSNDAAAQVVQEIHGTFHVALADAPADDCLLRSSHCDENVLIALGVGLVAQDILLLLRNEPHQTRDWQGPGADSTGERDRAASFGGLFHLALL